MTDVWTKLKSEELPILLYGTGNGADKILNELNRLDIKVSGIFASSGFVRDRYFHGFKVMSLEEAEKKYSDFIGLFSFGSSRPEVLENIKSIMTRHTLLVPEVPVCGDEIFNLQFAKSHSDELYRAYDLLCDDKSRKVFENIVTFKLTGDISKLFECETTEDEAFQNILILRSGDSFLDLGAYNGDTVLDFIKRVGTFSYITAVEPDPKTFAKLLKNTEDLGVECINAAISRKCGAIPFSFKSSRGSVSGGDDFIKSVNIDSLSQNRHFDYIKFDVEGKELEAIIGGEYTIKKDRPKMLISAYHKSEDLFTIPLKVHEFCPDYKIYIRHYPAVPAWDTNFYFV